MAQQDISAQVKRILAEYSGKPLDEIGDHASLEEDLGLDSLDRIEISMACEEQFNIEISDDETVQLRGVDDVVRLAQRLVG